MTGSIPSESMMSETVTVSCWECGGDVDVVVGPDGVEEGGHYSSVLVAELERMKDGATLVDEYLDEDIPDDHGAVVYTECGDCCHYCNSDLPPGPGE